MLGGKELALADRLFYFSLALIFARGNSVVWGKKYPSKEIVLHATIGSNTIGFFHLNELLLAFIQLMRAAGRVDSANHFDLIHTILY